MDKYLYDGAPGILSALLFYFLVSFNNQRKQLKRSEGS